MGHYRLADDMPSAIILAKNPRSGSLDELKTYQDNQIFLNNKTEFQIKLFNPLQEKIGAKITINGKSTNHLLVLNPGEDFTIDRFLDEQKRMIFETYNYDSGNEKAVKAVEKNGIIDISFFKEAYFFATSSTWYYDYNNTGGTIYPTGAFNTTTNIVNTNFDNNTFTVNNDLNHTLTSGNDVFYSTLGNTQGMGNVKVDGNNVSLDSLDFVEFADEPKTRVSKSKSLKKETGRVEKGQQSEQVFESVNINFETFPFYSVSYFLKPMSEKHTAVQEVREYCTSCGYRLRNKNWSFCPKCGQKIQ